MSTKPNISRHPLLPLIAPCLLACLASCGGPESHPPRISVPADNPSTSVADEAYFRTLYESDLSTQVDLLIDALRLGSAHAGARLITLGRWNEMALVDPRQPPLAAWAGSPDRIGTLTLGQIHGNLLANWAIRHAEELQGGKKERGSGGPLIREMRRALQGMWDGPLEDPMLLAELYWLIDEYGDSQHANAFHRWLLPRFLDGVETLDRHALRARLVQFTSLVSKGWLPEWIYGSACDKAVALARANGFIAVELALSRWRPSLPDRGNKPPLNGLVLMPDDVAQLTTHTQALLDLSRRAGEDRYVPGLLGTLAWLQGPDRLRFDAAPADPEAAWQEAAKLYAQKAEAALSARGRQEPVRPPDRERVRFDGDGAGHPMVVHASALIDQAWSLHQGIARAPQGVPQAIALYEQAIAALDDVVREYPNAFSYSSSPAEGATATLRWLRGEDTPTQQILPQYDGIDVPDGLIFQNLSIWVLSQRVGPNEDRGIGDERGWHDKELKRPAVSGTWKDGRRDGAWTWWHADGSLAVSGSFRAGIQVGRWRFMQPDGKLFVELDAGDGLFTGEVPIRNPDGTTRPGMRWQDGRQVLSDSPPPPRDGWRTVRTAQGRDHSAGAYTQDLETGPWTWWHEDGTTVKERAHMRMGLRDGEASTWDARSALESTGRWRCGLRDGTWTWFFPSGSKREVSTYRMGQMEGVNTRWHENGVIAETFQFRDGEMFGTSRRWYPSGRLQGIDQFGERPEDTRRSLFTEDGTPIPLKKLDGTPFPPAIEDGTL